MMHLPLIHTALLTLLFLICSSLAIPVTDPLAKDHISLPPPGRTAASKSAHQSRSLISSQGAGTLRYGQWKLLYSSLSLAVASTPDGNTILQSFAPLWNTVTYVSDGLRNVSPSMVKPVNHMPFRCGNVELILTSTELMQWDELAAYADALVSLASDVAGFWEVGFTLR